MKTKQPTALEMAIQNGLTNTARLLVESNADVSPIINNPNALQSLTNSYLTSLNLNEAMNAMNDEILLQLVACVLKTPVEGKTAEVWSLSPTELVGTCFDSEDSSPE